MPTLSFSHVSFAWPDGRRVFDDLTTAVPEGLSALVGRNGIGKSTLLRLALGELTPTAGTISTAGRLAYVPQDLILGVDARVIDVLGVAPGSTP
ncbi:ATP-binding cassette domain-containing protein [Demequina sediminis]|uniref:ATP-binding cassette domain-containing protein n=1 Tax=Demequina sediminis TaxID=1930058 RepID=UPI002573A1B4|nr:ATP-binding cassette domain-containing protein [Demequina sediminis]